ncbi:oligosaccharide flippase family protein [Candidatus Kapabacteria bacterium]|nr:oligosaccharide flippase family protein [Candidatus Kapabacteria bacterium]
MRIRDNLKKISWSFIDKGNYLLFGLFTLFQLKYLAPSDFAFYESMVLFNNWIFLLADGLALNGLIQFGGNKEEKPNINLMSLITIVVFSLSVSFLLFSFRSQIGSLFGSDSYGIALSYLPLISLITIPRNYTIKILTRELQYFSVFLLNLTFFGSQVVATLYILNSNDALSFLSMIYILIAGGVSSTLIAIVLSNKYLRFKTKGTLSYKKFLKFGFVVSQQQIFHSLPKIFDFHIISIFFGPEKAGIYAAAKKLYKTFDEAASAAHGLIYPISVKLIFQKNWVGLKALTVKSLSALLFVFGFLILILNFGLTEFMINYFDLERYLLAIGIFNTLVLAGLFLPFALLTPLMNALSKEKLVLKYKIIATLLSLTCLLIVSYNNLFFLTPITIIIYNFVLGLLCYNFVKTELSLKNIDIFGFAIDLKNMFKK